MGPTMAKCPVCGGNLGYDVEHECLICPNCHRSFFLDQVKCDNKKESGTKVKGYCCNNCGAQIVTSGSTISTECYYCHSPVVLTDRIENNFPDGIILFDITKEQAEINYKQFFTKKKFVDKKFFHRASVGDFSGVYYPYWYFDIDGQGSFSGDGDIVHESKKGDYRIITTDHYHLEREGFVELRNIYRKALRQADQKMIDGIHPYDTSYIRPFSIDHLIGYLAEETNMDESEAKNGALKEAESRSEWLMKKDSGLSNLHGANSFTPERIRIRYVLLPTWIMTYIDKEEDQIYTYLMNGQTGKVCGKVPLNHKKLIGASIGIDVLALVALLCFILFIFKPYSFGITEIILMLIFGLPAGIIMYFITKKNYNLEKDLYRFDYSKQGTARYTINERTHTGTDVKREYEPEPDYSSRNRHRRR